MHFSGDTIIELYTYKHGLTTTGGVTTQVTQVGAAFTVPTSWFTAATAPAVGIISAGAGPPLSGTWDFIEVTN